jgi:hypothetical protein
MKVNNFLKLKVCNDCKKYPKSITHEPTKETGVFAYLTVTKNVYEFVCECGKTGKLGQNLNKAKFNWNEIN